MLTGELGTAWTRAVRGAKRAWLLPTLVPHWLFGHPTPQVLGRTPSFSPLPPARSQPQPAAPRLLRLHRLSLPVVAAAPGPCGQTVPAGHPPLGRAAPLSPTSSPSGPIADSLLHFKVNSVEASALCSLASEVLMVLSGRLSIGTEGLATSGRELQRGGVGGRELRLAPSKEHCFPEPLKPGFSLNPSSTLVLCK